MLNFFSLIVAFAERWEKAPRWVTFWVAIVVSFFFPLPFLDTLYSFVSSFVTGREGTRWGDFSTELKNFDGFSDLKKVVNLAMLSTRRPHLQPPVYIVDIIIEKYNNPAGAAAATTNPKKQNLYETHTRSVHLRCRYVGIFGVSGAADR